jgi:hypothetical protein
MSVFVIGDVHGHLDRLEALLKQEGLLVRCEWCDGGQVFGGSATHMDLRDCGHCKGLGQRRAKADTAVVQLGDLGHFGIDASPTADLLCYKYVTENHWADVVLWGNHDRAQIDNGHAFSGFLRNHEALHYIKMLHNEGRLQLAYEAYGFLITHAGLAGAFRDQPVVDEYKTSPQTLADWLNVQDLLTIGGEDCDEQAQAIRDAIGTRRGGPVPTGGILWRDIEEKLYDGFRQIFGHSADRKKHQVRYCAKNLATRDASSVVPRNGWSYCIDIGGKGEPGADCLAGIWLPSEKIVRVDL